MLFYRAFLLAAKRAVSERLSLDGGRLRKREFRELVGCIVDALRSSFATRESLDAFLAFLRSNLTVSAARGCGTTTAQSSTKLRMHNH